MGTRNLTVVVKDGEYKVAQYGQWDGYPSGNGVEILEFLRKNFAELIDKLHLVQWITDEEQDKTWEGIKSDPTSHWVDFHEASAHEKLYPELSRNTGARILDLILNFEPTEDKPVLKIYNAIDFASSPSCEWAWVIDYDKGTFEAYEGYNKEPLTLSDRFYTGKEPDYGYYPVKLVAKWYFYNLPEIEGFLKTFEVEEDEEE